VRECEVGKSDVTEEEVGQALYYSKKGDDDNIFPGGVSIYGLLSYHKC